LQRIDRIPTNYIWAEDRIQNIASGAVNFWMQGEEREQTEHSTAAVPFWPDEQKEI
jgi:hypothetical protein